MYTMYMHALLEAYNICYLLYRCHCYVVSLVTIELLIGMSRVTTA